jgi:hypothetical protein
MTQDEQRIIALQAALDSAVRERDMTKVDIELVSRLHESVSDEKDRLIDRLTHQIKAIDDRLKVMSMLVGEKAMKVADLEKENITLRYAMGMEGD